MKREFVPYDIALAMKELGFNFTGDYPYFEQSKCLENGYTYSPLYQQAFRWFREKYGLHCYPEPISHEGKMVYCMDDEIIGTYEEAEIACLRKLIEIAKNTL